MDRAKLAVYSRKARRAGYQAYVAVADGVLSLAVWANGHKPWDEDTFDATYDHRTGERLSVNSTSPLLTKLPFLFDLV